MRGNASRERLSRSWRSDKDPVARRSAAHTRRGAAPSIGRRLSPDDGTEAIRIPPGGLAAHRPGSRAPLASRTLPRSGTAAGMLGDVLDSDDRARLMRMVPLYARIAGNANAIPVAMDALTPAFTREGDMG